MVHRWAQERVKPIAAQVDRENVFPADLWREMGELGLLGITVPEEYGGTGAGYVSYGLVAREVERVDSGYRSMMSVQASLVMHPINAYGSEEQRRKYLPKLCSGEHVGALAMSEEGAGSDVVGMKLRADKRNGYYVLNGSKYWITNGPDADTLIVYAKTDPEAGSKGITAFIVDKGAPGLDDSAHIHVMAPHPLATLRFTDCRIPASALLGETGQGFKVAMSVLDVFRATVAAAALGFARRALDEALARVMTRQIAGSPLADLQMVQGHIAEMAVDVDASALLVYRAAWTRDSGAPRITREAAMAKLFATDRAQEVIDKAVQLHGADGVRSGHAVETLYREIRALRIYEGASDVQKVVIARQTLGG